MQLYVDYRKKMINQKDTLHGHVGDKSATATASEDTGRNPFGSGPSDLRDEDLGNSGSPKGGEGGDSPEGTPSKRGGLMSRMLGAPVARSKSGIGRTKSGIGRTASNMNLQDARLGGTSDEPEIWKARRSSSLLSFLLSFRLAVSVIPRVAPRNACDDHVNKAANFVTTV
jgi:hypothetical protein